MHGAPPDSGFMVKFEDTWFLLDGSWANAVRNPTPEEKEQLASIPPTPTTTGEDSDSSEYEDEPAGIPSDIIKMEVLRTLQFLLRGGQVNHNMIRQILFLFSALHNSTNELFLQPFLYHTSRHSYHNNNKSKSSDSNEIYIELHEDTIFAWVSMVNALRCAKENVVQLRVVGPYNPPDARFSLKKVILLAYFT